MTFTQATKASPLQRIESRLVHSFSNVHQDVERLTNENTVLKAHLQDMQFSIEKLEEQHASLLQVLATFQEKEMKQLQRYAGFFIGIQDTRELHREDCLLAKVDGERGRIIFDTKDEALKKGFQECVCLQ